MLSVVLNLQLAVSEAVLGVVLYSAGTVPLRVLLKSLLMPPGIFKEVKEVDSRPTAVVR